MTDKEQIIIDGINVKKCKHFCLEPQIPDMALAGFSKICGEEYIAKECEDNPDCYFKQLARKTRECEELISEKDFYLQKIAVLEQECEELKRQKAVLKSWSKHLEQWKDNLLKDNDYYRNTLENIEKIIKEYDCVNCSEQHCEDCNKGEIFYIINKVKGE